MLILKHVGFEIPDNDQLNHLIAHIQKTTSQIGGIKFNDILFPKNKKEFVLFLECENEEIYHRWRKICPPPPGAEDWYEAFISKEDKFSI